MTLLAQAISLPLVGEVSPEVLSALEYDLLLVDFERHLSLLVDLLGEGFRVKHR